MHPTVVHKGDDLYLIYLLQGVARRARLTVPKDQSLKGPDNRKLPEGFAKTD